MKNYRLLGLLAGFLSSSLSADYLDYKKTKIVAIQNKTFTLRHELKLSPIYLPFDPYTKGVGIGLSYTYHFNDTIAWELLDANMISSYETSLRNKLVSDYKADTASFKEIKYIFASALRYTPFYYKGVLFNSLILHGHGYFLFGFSMLRVTEGAGVQNTKVEGWKAGTHIGVGGNLVTTKDIVLCIHLKDHLYWENKGFTQVLALNVGFGINFGKSE